MQNYAVFVPHFHWDREWYEPFQVFRHRLVEALDTVLLTAEADPSFRFTVDGQTAAIRDYLEMRPQNRGRVEALVARGQLALGPWYILLDEFLCSGETIVRNLRFGWSDATALGRAMPIGYLPDMFGHVAQMPQILRRAGIEHAALWRGVPGSVDGHAFRWQAPDGSEVRTEFLFDGYDNGLDILLVPAAIGRALGDYARMTQGRWGTDPVLAMAGTDHAAPNPRLGEWLRAAERPELGIRIASVEEYVTELALDPVEAVVEGELRSHVRGNILPGVLSARAELKRAMALAERTVDHAERFAALWGRPDADETPFLDLAWRKIIESSAHDSVVGSGTDETSDQVESRLEEAAQSARAVRDAVLAEQAETVPSDAYLVANPLPYPRTATVEVQVERAGDCFEVELVDGTVAPAQYVAGAPTVLSDETLDADQLERVLRRIHRRELFGRQINGYDLRPGALTFFVAEVASKDPFDLMELRGEVARAAAETPGPWRVRTTAEPVATVAVTLPLPASGLTSFRVRSAQESGQVSAVQASGRTVDNGLVSATVGDDGTIDIRSIDGTALSGVGRLVDGGDRGDSYNYGPPARDSAVDAPRSTTVEILERGPVRASIRIVREYEWPVALSENPDERSEEMVRVPVETVVEVHADEPFVRLTTSFVNPAADHRLRLHLPLPEPVTRSASEGQFAITERGLTSEGGWGEFPLPTFPATSFVSAGAATVLLDHAGEYEVVGHGRELAITLLRAIGAISVNLHPLRDEPAALNIAAPGAQEIGQRILSRIAILPSQAGWRSSAAVRAAELFRNEPSVIRGSAVGEGALPSLAEGLRVTHPDVAVTAIRRSRDGVEVRLVALSPDPVETTVTGDFVSAREVDLLGRETGPAMAASGSLELRLKPWEIRSLLLGQESAG